MAIVYPRDMPELSGRCLWNQVDFAPAYMQARAPLRGGVVQVINIGADLWTMSYVTSALTHQQAMDYMAWLHSLRGGARLFKAWHPLRRYPYLYPNGFGGLNRAGGGSFDGTCTLSAIGAARDTISLSTLPAGLQISVGDMVSFAIGASRGLVQVLDAAVANGAGAVTLTVEPFVPLAASVGAAATLVKPWCLAVLDPSSVSGPVQPGFVQSISFKATQTY